MKRVKITAISITAAVLLLIGWNTARSQVHISTDGPPPSMEEMKGLLAAYKAASEQPDMAPRIIELRAVKKALSAQEIGKPVLRIMPPYYSWPGEEAVLWGAVVPDNGVGDFSGNEYTWDFGDGSDPDTGTIENANYIKVQHTYVTAGQKTATLTVKTESETLSKTVKINVFADNLETRRLKAIEDGLRWLYTQARTDGFIGNNTYRAGETGLAVLAFEEQGHYAINDPDIDIYAPIVKRGLEAIMGTAQKYVFSDYTTPAHPGNFDSNGNGHGIYFLDYLDAAKYTTGVCMLTVIASRTPEEVVEEGQAAGMTYKQVMQDLCDYFAFTQSDTTAFYRGGWRYTPDHTGDGDHSAAQWPALGMMAAEKEWGCFVPQWVKDEVEVWLINTQSTSNFSYGYQGYNSVGLSGAALCQWAFIGENTANERVENTLKYMADNWGSTDSRNGHFNRNFYSFYAIAKGFRVMHHPDGHQINLIGDHNWWNEYVDHLLNDETISQKSQESDGRWATGYWNGAGYNMDVPTMQNSLAILVLSPGVFDLPPVAVITGPDGAQPNVNVSLNGAKSYHQDPEKSVVEWLWDFDKSDRIDWNKPDAVGQNVTKVDGWSAPDGERTVFVSLRVKDNSDPPMYDTEEHKIIITGDVNHPPIADAGGPYAARPGEEIILDGTGSYDPDPGDSISAYAWDLDGDGEYDDSDDPQPSIIWEGVKSGLIGLKVWDQDNLNSSDEAPVYVEVWTSEKDLAVTGEGLEVSNVRPEPGEMITLTVTGQYTSDDEAELDIAKVRFYNGNPDSSYIHIEDYILENLSSGDNFKITVPWTVPEGFKSSVWVKLDFDDQVMEFEETNNTDFLGLEVSGEPVFNTRLFFEPDPVRIVGINIGDDTAFPGLVSLMVKDVYDLMGANIEISFDPDKVNVLDMFPGEFMERNADFVSDFGTFNNETGTITISLVRLDALPTGVTGSGAIADIFLVAVAEDPTSELIISSYSLRDSQNNEIWVMSAEDGAIEGIGDLLGDFENDLDVDFEDYTQLVVYWNEDDFTGDIVGSPEQPNMAGSPPWSKTNYPYEPDGAIDFEDQMVFALMYNWYRFSTGDMFDVYKPSILAKRITAPFEIGLNVNGNFSDIGNIFTVSIDAKNMYDLMGSEAVLKYNHDMLRVKSVNSLPSLETDSITAPVLYKYESGMLRAGMAVLGSSFHGLSCPDCSLFEVEFEVIEEGPFNIELAELDVRNYRNEQVAVQILNSTVTGKTVDELNAAVPMMFGLTQNYPNPFNMSTTIGFTLAEAGMVEISIYNMLGQEVKSLIGEMRQPGRYDVVWNGTDEKGDEVTSGVYFVNLIQGNSADTRRLLLIK